MTRNVEATQVRPAGLNERRCIARDVLGLYGCIVTTAVYTSKSAIDESAFKELIESALQQCISQHPTLRLAISSGEGEPPQIVKPSALNLTDHYLVFSAGENSLNAKGMQGFLEDVHNQSLYLAGEVRPAWKVYIKPLATSSEAKSRFSVAFAISHALADGASAIMFHKSFCEALPTGTTHDQAETPKTTNILPPLEVLAKLTISWSYFASVLAGIVLPSWLSRTLGLRDDRGVWMGSHSRPPLPTPPELVHTKVKLRSFSKDVASQLLSISREHLVKLTGLVAMVTARSLAKALRDRGQEVSKFKAAIAMDLRRCIPAAQGSFGNYVSAISETLTVSNREQFVEWDQARRVTENLGKASNTLQDHVVGLLKFVSDVADWVKQRASTPADASFGVSNVGVLDNPNTNSSDGNQRWRIEDLIFSQSADATGEPFNVNVASTKSGNLNFTLTWWPGMLGVEDEEVMMDEICDGIVEDIARIIENYVGSRR